MSIFDPFRGILSRITTYVESRRASKARQLHAGLDRRIVQSLSGNRIPTTKQLRHLPRFLSSKERMVVRMLTGVAMISVLVLAGNYAKRHIVEVPAVGGTYVEGSVGGPRFVNPVLAAGNDVDLDIIELVFSGLMKNDANGQLVPDLAASYEVSEDGKTYTFTLRDDVQWHDGTAFAANDVLATVSYIRHAAWKSPLAAKFKNVKADSPDPLTVVFTLEEPFAPFLSLLTMGIVPEHLWQEVRPENAARADLNVKPIGTGPYTFKSYAKDKKGAIRSYTLERSDTYYGDEPKIETITFMFFEDFGLASQALLERKVDGISFLPLDYRDDVAELRTVRIHTPRLPQYTGIFFNAKNNSVLTSKEVRHALALAIDKDMLVQETLGDNGLPVHGPILPGFVGFHPDIKKYPRDLAAANDLLDETKWKMNTEGLRTATVTEENEDGDDVQVEKPLTITITTVDAKENVTVAQAVQRAWAEIGITVVIDAVPADAIQKDRIRPRQYEALIYGEIIGADPDPYPFWHSSQNADPGLNLAGFSNRTVDELLENARATNNTEKREEMYVKFQDILAEEVPAIFLYSPTYTYAVSRRVQGVEAATVFSPSDRFSNVESWYIKTKKDWQ